MLRKWGETSTLPGSLLPETRCGIHLSPWRSIISFHRELSFVYFQNVSHLREIWPTAFSALWTADQSRSYLHHSSHHPLLRPRAIMRARSSLSDRRRRFYCRTPPVCPSFPTMPPYLGIPAPRRKINENTRVWRVCVSGIRASDPAVIAPVTKDGSSWRRYVYGRPCCKTAISRRKMSIV